MMNITVAKGLEKWGMQVVILKRIGELKLVPLQQEIRKTILALRAFFC